MKFHLRIVQAVLVFVLASTMVWSDESQVARFALLIGVQEYPNLSDAEQLDGCENDVRILSDVLTARLNVPAENITRLVNDGATSTAIRAAMERMVHRVENTHVSAQAVAHQVNRWVALMLDEGGEMVYQPR